MLILEAGRAERHYWRDLWKYRELLGILAWRDVTVRYKQTLIGIAWAVLRPFLTMVAFTIVFGRIAGLQASGSAPYALMVLAGMLPWYLFASGAASAADSVMANSGLISKIYFPRIIVPVSTVATALIDFLVSLALLAALLAWYRYSPGWRIALLPAFVALALMTTVGAGLLFAALNVKYRDFRHVVPFLMQIGLYISPVGFASALVPEKWRALYYLNPMAGVIDGFRWCVLGADAVVDWGAVALSQAVGVLLLWLGVRLFRKTERSFADLF